MISGTNVIFKFHVCASRQVLFCTDVACQKRRKWDNELQEALICCYNYSEPAPVHFKDRSRKELVRRGSLAVLRCQALGDLPISLTWRKEGSFVELQGRIRYSLKISVSWKHLCFLSCPIWSSEMFC